MSYTYLQEQGEESSAASFADIPQFALSNGTSTHARSCLPDSETDACHDSQSGMTCKHSTASRGGGALISSAEDSLAKTLAAQERAQELRDHDQVCGFTWPESLAKYDQNTSSWRTRQCLLFEDLGECLETWPQWGMMRNGECWALNTSALCTEDADCGSWPTPQRIDEDFCRMTVKSASRDGHQPHVTTELIRIHSKRYPLPNFGEALMGFPSGWTKDGEWLETHKFQEWLRLHSNCYPLALMNQ